MGQKWYDGKASELASWFRAHISPNGAMSAAPPGDSKSTGAADRNRPGSPLTLTLGMVTAALPQLHSYRVQTATHSAIIACKLQMLGSTEPIGVRETAPIALGSVVVVGRVEGLPYWAIMGILPKMNLAERLQYFDFLQYGSNTGLNKERGYHAVLDCATEGDMLNFNCLRPIDTQAGDLGFMASSGVHLTLDEQQAVLALHDGCGLFLNSYDDHARFIAACMEITTLGAAWRSFDDEGELSSEFGETPYPWEALGAYTPSETIQTTLPITDEEAMAEFGPVKPAQAAQEAFWRYREYGGYLGQGKRRMVVARPLEASGVRHLGDSLDDVGLWEEVVDLTGYHVTRSARGILMAKETLLPVPRRVHQTADSANGDDRQKGNYRFAGQYGDGEQHTLKGVSFANDKSRPIKSLAGQADQSAHQSNWIGLHPFHLHANDFHLPQEDETPLYEAPAALDFDGLVRKPVETEEVGVTLNIDHRFQNVKYYRGRSFVHLLPDGGVMVGEACGATISLTGGEIYIDAPGGIHVRAGRNVNLDAGFDITMRAQKSIDSVASTGDHRAKAHGNMQLLAGDGGQGGILLESAATSANNDFTKTGEEAVSSGILLRSAHGPVITAAKDIYLRTGSDGIEEGQIVLDAAKGQKSIVTYSDAFVRYTGNVLDNFTTSGVVSAANFSSSDGNLFAGSLFCGAQGIFDGDMIANGNVIAAAGNVLATSGAPDVGDLKGEGLSKLKASLSTIRKDYQKGVKSQATAFKSLFEGALYKGPSGYGSETLQSRGKFSYRDTEDGKQYGITPDSLVVLEPRWQQMVRNNEATGGQAWKEKPLSSDKNLYPFPGKKAYEGSVLYQYAYNCYDPETGAAKPRPYTSEEAGTWTGRPLNEYLGAKLS